jgi:hypothetical protein
MIWIDFINEVTFEVIEELVREGVAGGGSVDDVEDDGEVVEGMDGVAI